MFNLHNLNMSLSTEEVSAIFRDFGYEHRVQIAKNLFEAGAACFVIEQELDVERKDYHPNWCGS